MESLINSLSPLERRVFPLLKKTTDFEVIVKESNLKEVEVMRALQWLSNKGIVELSYKSEEYVEMGKNLIKAREQGFPEEKIVRLLEEKSRTMTELARELGLSPVEVGGVFGVLKSKKIVQMEKQAGMVKIFLSKNEKAKLEWDNYISKLIKFRQNRFPLPISKINKEVYLMLKGRKGFVETISRKQTMIKITDMGKKALSQKIDFSKVSESLTSDMLKTGEWKGKTFRTYDISSKVPAVTGGRRHPLSEACNIVRDIFLEMGFQEMESPLVETAFWCMDSMWIPQDHPARDIQDTFFVKGKGDLPESALVKRVKEVQENGGKTGSTGHMQKWDPEIARQLLLRTHSTAASFRKFGIDKIKEDCKYFYIADTFRNETADSTHLPEFTQAEGFIMADGLTLADLMGFVREFYAKLGITKIRFKPTYNPYTEPSMEAHYYDKKKKKWYALINSGIFRPEALAPYGIKKPVLAWGMGVSRMASILTKKNNLRELVGATCDIEDIRNHKILKKEI